MKCRRCGRPLGDGRTVLGLRLCLPCVHQLNITIKRKGSS